MKNKFDAPKKDSNEPIMLDDGLVETQEDLLTIAATLVVQLQEKQMDKAKQTIYNLCQLQEKNLFQEIGKLTRKMHESLNHFANDDNLETLMQESLPDAKKRLDYVVQLTEESAHKTLTAVEQCMPISSRLKDDAQYLQQQIDGADRTAGNSEEGSRVTLNQFLSRTIEQSETLNSCLTEILMAQTFQDVTGQVIQRVIKLVKEVEDSLVSMIRTCGSSTMESEKTNRSGGKESNKETDNKGYGPVVPGLITASSANNSSDDGGSGGGSVQSQDEVDDLLSTLGF